MIRPLTTSCALLLALSASLVAEEPHDLLRFSNGDQLHGQFNGITDGPSISWKRADLNEVAEFGIDNLRHLVFRGGNPAKPLKSISLVELINGDKIPGKITALNDKQVTIETSCAGTLSIDINKVARIAPQPLGGRLHYHGPFSEKPWEVVAYGNGEEAQQEDAPDAGEQEVEAEGAESSWQHSGAAWFWKSTKPGDALILRDQMPKRSTLRFDLAWKNQLNVAIAVHADFCVEKQAIAKNGEEQKVEQQVAGRARFVPHDSSSLPSIFGNAFILQIHSNYMVIYRSVVDAEGNKSVKRVQTASNRLRIGENSKSTFELRSDLEDSTYSLFVNGEFVVQWSDPALKDDKIEPISGNSLAFMPQIAKGQLRITDVIIAEWNGMPDSARSLETEDQDIIVMTNGLDRLSGKALSLEAENMLRFKGRHGEFLLPMEDIAELRLATNERIKPEPVSGPTMQVRFSPMGRITGTPMSGDRNTMMLRSQLAGDITIRNEAAVMFEFNDSDQIFTDWDANF